jgi:hypothetical protein
MPRPKPSIPSTSVMFRTTQTPELDAFALEHGLIKGQGKYAQPRDEPEPNRSAALNLLLPWALQHYPAAGSPEAEAIRLATAPPPKLSDRDRVMLAHLLQRGAAEVAVLLQSEPVDPETGTVAGQTARRLVRLGLVEFTEHDGRRQAQLTEYGQHVAATLDTEV